MDKLQNWIKKNKLFAAVIGLFIAYFAFTQFSQPRNYNDCVLQVVKQATNDKSAIMGRQACRSKFPKRYTILGNTNPYIK